jgi:hypothetical protein
MNDYQVRGEKYVFRRAARHSFAENDKGVAADDMMDEHEAAAADVAAARIGERQCVADAAARGLRLFRDHHSVPCHSRLLGAPGRGYASKADHRAASATPHRPKHCGGPAQQSCVNEASFADERT